MSSRIIVQLLLSLLLLVSQQLALSHVYTHVPAPGGVAVLGDSGDEGKRPIASDHLCGLCVSGDQLAHALGVPSYSFKAVAPEYLPLAAADTPAACLRTVCVFHSRAPPQA
ncbi:hypothetical protein [Pseudoduganella armeniaca]|uniref:DUF2946 domain-containing protein n=1 Tax=Pseudoduganella armeniaca TaxID=2072590 RepID=A0A2R4C5Y8_9BURK|nr:hypothetical protein [Pseudoduganella armeniaca]AVR94948.1 hypothetical protein C9I28_03875 [Pseudoduganella armeniaca]